MKRGAMQPVAGIGKSDIQQGTAKTIVYFIADMDCPDEMELVRKRLDPLAGVASFEPNTMTRKLTVTYRPNEIGAEEIKRELLRTGLKVETETQRKSLSGKKSRLEPKLLLLALSGLITLTTFIASRFGVATEEFANGFYGLATLIGSYFPAKLGFAALKTLTLNIRLLMVAGALGAISLGLWEEAALLVFIYLLGDVLEAFAVDRARGSIRALMELVPSAALVKRNGAEVEAPVGEVGLGEIAIVKPGEKIPLDGVVVAGSSTVDQAPITGESIPALKEKGDEVFAGSVNQRGALEIEITKFASDTVLAKIIHLVEEAQAKKSKYQRFGETFGKYYTPSMFVLALVVIALPPLLFGQDFSAWYLRGLIVLVVSCSCGLALSVPVAVVTTIGNAARHGVLIKGGAYLEVANDIKVIAFDKTGTLTLGRPEVTDILSVNAESKDEILAVAAAIETRSEHPLADAILRAAEERKLDIPAAEDFQSVTGLGAEARIDGAAYRIGNRRFFDGVAEAGGNGPVEKTIVALENEGKTVVIVGDKVKILGVIAVADRLRPHVKEIVAKLKTEGIKKVVMLTGDNDRTASAIAARAGVDEYLAELLPDDKVAAIKNLRERYGKVAMIGDGINDAPAMASADLGIAMGGGTGVAFETGDMALVSDELSKIPFALHLAKRSVGNMKQNIFASLAIVAFLVPAALLGAVGLVPGLLINEVSALIVIVNGLRLLR